MSGTWVGAVQDAVVQMVGEQTEGDLPQHPGGGTEVGEHVDVVRVPWTMRAIPRTWPSIVRRRRRSPARCAG